MTRFSDAARSLGVVLLVAVASGCSGDERYVVPNLSEPDAAAGFDLDARSAEPIPGRFGVGREANPPEVAALALHVMPDGQGLPAGQGTATAGEPIYLAKCAVCHGPDLEGSVAGDRLAAVAGAPEFADGETPNAQRTIGNYWPYATTLFDYVRRAMPFDQPGSLTDDEVYALTAYMLYRNGVIGEADVINAQSLPAVEMPARDRFVTDDRLESDVVR